MQVYPWALLVFWQLLMPAVSFWGHLGGLLAGELFVRGWLKALVPSEGTFQAIHAACKPCCTMQSSNPRCAGAMHTRDVHEVILGGWARLRGGSGRAESGGVCRAGAHQALGLLHGAYRRRRVYGAAHELQREQPR